MNSLPPVIASWRPLVGHSLVDKRRDLELLERFHSPSAVEQWLEGAASCGVGAVAAIAEPRLLAAAAKRRDLGIEFVPVVPNVMGLVREATEYGMMGAGFRLVWRLGPSRLIRIGLSCLPKTRSLLRRDFGAVMSVLWDMELGLFRRFRPRCVLLHPQITDLALALGNRELFAAFARDMRQRHGLEPGVATHNFGRLAEQIEAWGIDMRLAMTPVNDAGWLMKPTREACERHLMSDRFSVIADRPGLTPPPTPAEIAAARRRPAVRSVMVDVADWEEFGQKADGASYASRHK